MEIIIHFQSKIASIDDWKYSLENHPNWSDNIQLYKPTNEDSKFRLDAEVLMAICAGSSAVIVALIQTIGKVIEKLMDKDSEKNKISEPQKIVIRFSDEEEPLKIPLRLLEKSDKLIKRLEDKLDELLASKTIDRIDIE